MNRRSRSWSAPRSGARPGIGRRGLRPADPVRERSLGIASLISSDYTGCTAHSRPGGFTLSQPRISATLPGFTGDSWSGAASVRGRRVRVRTLPAGSGPAPWSRRLEEILRFPTRTTLTRSPELTSSTGHEVTVFRLRERHILIFNSAATYPHHRARLPTATDMSRRAHRICTREGLPVASGIYVVRIDVEGVGSKTDRVAVFIEQERLDNF